MEGHQDLINYYEKKLKKHKGGSLAVDWNCQEAQEMLFFALIDGLDEDYLRSGEAKILDVGCGLGALNGFLERQGYKVQYTGIDIAPGMVETAQKNYPGAHFEVRDMLKNPYPTNFFDYVFLSGSLSIKIKNHERYVRRMIWRMFDCAKRALSFNLLSGRSLGDSRVFQLDDLRYYPQPLAIMDFCHSLTPLVNMRHEAAGWTFTMQLFKKQDITSRVINRYVTYLEGQHSATADSAIANTLMEVGAIARTLNYHPADEENSDYWNFKAVCLARLGQTAGQVEALKKALAINPKHEWATLNLGTVAHAEGDLDKATTCYRQVLALDKENNVARSQLFYILLRRGDNAAAMELIKGFNGVAERLYFTGEYHYLTKDYLTAYKVFGRALKRANYLAEAHRKMALSAHELGLTKQELRHWQQLNIMLPYDDQAVTWLADYYYEHGQYRRVVSMLEEKVGNSSYNSLRGRALYAMGRRKAAREAWEENVNDTMSISSLLDLAEIDIEEGLLDEGAKYLGIAADLPEAAEEGWSRRILGLTIKHKVVAGSGCYAKKE